MNRVPGMWVWCALTVAAGLAGCGQHELREHLAAQVRVPDRPVLLVFVDGVQKARFESLLRAGKLPNIDRYLVRGGVSVERATTVVPSITYAVTTTYLTGLTPGRHGIVGNAFFDRHQLIYHDYKSIHNYREVTRDLRAPTLHEILTDRYTVNILLPDGRGADRNFNDVLSFGSAWFAGMFATVDYLTTTRLDELAEEANRCARWPDLIVAYYAATDEVGHRSGPDSERYERILVNHDRQLGWIMRFLEANGLRDRYTIVWTTDHGMSACPNRVAAGELFREHLGIRCVDHQFDEDSARDADRLMMFMPLRRMIFARDEAAAHYDERVLFFHEHTCVIVPDGKRKISVHLRVGDDWGVRPTYAQIQAFGPEAEAPADARFSDRLLAEPSIGLVVVRDGPNRVHVLGQAGHAIIERSEAGYVYRAVEGADPLGYASHAPAASLMDGRSHSGDAWRRATYASRYPDVVGQMLELFDHHRAGDLIVFAADGWSYEANKVGAHGGLNADDMRVPMFFAGPGLPAGGAVDTARTLDVAPTILGLMGCVDRIATFGPMDGRNLAPLLRRARPAASQPTLRENADDE